MLKNRVISFLMAVILIIVFGIFIYPGIYKYDKLRQNMPVKINRLTGDTKVLTITGWANMNTPTLSEIQKIEENLNQKFEDYKSNLSEEIIHKFSNDAIQKINDASNQAIYKIQKQLSDTEDEINTDKKVSTDSNNFFLLDQQRMKLKV